MEPAAQDNLNAEPAGAPATSMEQLAARDREIAALQAQVASAERAVREAEGRPAPFLKAFMVELYWRTATTDFQAADCVRVNVGCVEMFRTFFLELPTTTGDALRLDLGSEPAVWLFENISVYDLSAEGALVEPPMLRADIGNHFAGVRALRGTVTNPVTLLNNTRVLRVLCWDHDPQLEIAIPREFQGKSSGTRVLAMTCRVVEPIRLLMEQSVSELFPQIGALETRVKSLEGTVQALQTERDQLRGSLKQLEAVKKSHVFRFTRRLSRLYHGVVDRFSADAGPAAM